VIARTDVFTKTRKLTPLIKEACWTHEKLRKNSHWSASRKWPMKRMLWQRCN